MHLPTTFNVVLLCAPFLLSAFDIAPDKGPFRCCNSAHIASDWRNSTPRSPGRHPGVAINLERRLSEFVVQRRDANIPLRARADDIIQLRNGWLLNFLYADAGLPVQVASALLEDYYQRVYLRVIQYARTLGPMKALSLTILDLQLDFQCETSVIQWDFIKLFVIAMIDATKRGFTGRFRAYMYHGPTETMIIVGLKIMGSQEPTESTENGGGSHRRTVNRPFHDV